MPFQMAEAGISVAAASHHDFERQAKLEKFREVLPISMDGEAKVIPQSGEQQQNRISVADLRELMIQQARNKSLTQLKIVDCRFPYEFEGGHLAGAVNVPTQEQLREMFFGTPEKLRALSGAVIIFHCEFS